MADRHGTFEGLKVAIFDDSVYKAADLDALVRRLGGSVVATIGTPREALRYLYRLVDTNQLDVVMLDVEYDGNHAWLEVPRRDSEYRGILNMEGDEDGPITPAADRVPVIGTSREVETGSLVPTDVYAPGTLWLPDRRPELLTAMAPAIRWARGQQPAN